MGRTEASLTCSHYSKSQIRAVRQIADCTVPVGSLSSSIFINTLGVEYKGAVH